MTSQLALDISINTTSSFHNFWPADNAQVISQLQYSLQDDAATLIYLHGPKNTGKTHLLQACAHQLKQEKKSVINLSLQALAELPPQIIDGMEHLNVIIFDDINCISQNKAWEEALFHCYNRCQETKCKWIISADTAPRHLQLALPDLQSRLSHGITLSMSPLSDQDKVRTLIYRAQRLGLTLSQASSEFLLKHYPRHMSAQIELLNTLEKTSLATGRKITIPFIKETLNNQQRPLKDSNR